jgi:hypothetical protein
MSEQEVPETPVGLEQRFRSLVAAWKADEGVSSSLSDRFAHPAYRQIIALGAPAVTLLLAGLDRDPDWWFAALKAITAADPVPAAKRGRLKEMTCDWLEWGGAQGIRR